MSSKRIDIWIFKREADASLISSAIDQFFLFVYQNLRAWVKFSVLLPKASFWFRRYVPNLCIIIKYSCSHCQLREANRKIRSVCLLTGLFSLCWSLNIMQTVTYTFAKFKIFIASVRSQIFIIICFNCFLIIAESLERILCDIKIISINS